MATIIPRGNNERVSWTLSFEDTFPGLAAGLGFSTTESQALLEDSAMLRFVIQNSISAAAHAKATNSYKYSIINGIEDGESEPALPVLTATPVPEKITLSGVLDRLNKAIARIKTSNGYSEAIGDALLINPSSPDSAIPADTKPSGTWTALPANVIRIDWAKGKFDGVIVEGQRGDESAWTRLDRDTRSPFDDERPNVTGGKPEERRYRLLYFLNDETVGTYSDIIVAVTMA